METLDINRTDLDYEKDILEWRERMENELRGENGWLKLAGLFWLQEGEARVGSASDSEILLPPGSAPQQVGLITLYDNVLHFYAHRDVEVYIDNTPISDAQLRDDSDSKGASCVTVEAIRFFVIKRGDRYAVRVINHEHPSLKLFKGRQWFPINPDLRVTGHFTAYPEARTLPVINSVDQIVPMRNPGVVTFTLHGQTLRLEAFEGSSRDLWFIFKDQTNGFSTYGAGRFLTAPVSENGTVDLDFNRSYSPPCAFTPYATCPFAPRTNHLPVRIEAGERVAL